MGYNTGVKKETHAGITGTCPDCGYTAFSEANILFGWIKIPCSNPNLQCKGKILLMFFPKQETIVKILKVAAVLVIGVIVSSWLLNAADAIHPKCKDFKTPDRTWSEARAAAQMLYDTNPKQYANLDGYDKDGKVCEK